MADRAELPVPVPRRQLSFYGALVFLVIPVWSIIPLAWLYTIYGTYSSLTRKTRTLSEVSAVELYALAPWALVEVSYDYLNDDHIQECLIRLHATGRVFGLSNLSYAQSGVRPDMGSPSRRVTRTSPTESPSDGPGSLIRPYLRISPCLSRRTRHPAFGL